MDKRVEQLVRKLTPSGKLFLKRLDKALAEELAALNSAGGDAIQAEIAQHHMRSMDSVQSVNRLAESGRRPRLTSHYMIMNYATMLLATDGRHRVRDRLTPTGEQLLQIWRIHANKLVDAGEMTQERIDAEEAKLLESIQKAGRGGGESVLSRIRSLFVKKGE